jgi:hypothetical protein
MAKGLTTDEIMGREPFAMTSVGAILALTLLAAAGPDSPKEPPSQAGMAAISRWGKDLSGSDSASGPEPTGLGRGCPRRNLASGRGSTKAQLMPFCRHRYNQGKDMHSSEREPDGARRMIIERIEAMLRACETGQPVFPPSVLFNEGWLLRIVLDWFMHHGGDRYPLSPRPGARWFSEPWLPSAFLPRHRGDRLAEARSHADAVLGHFAIGDPGTAGLTLLPAATQLVVVEAKLFARLSTGVKNAPYFDQAARSVACMAEVLRRAGRPARSMDDLSLLIVAPQARIDDGVFAWDAAPEAIRRKVRRRVEDYAGERDAWFRDWFEPTWERVDVRCLCWEEIIEVIAFHNPEAGQVVDSFYGRCLHYNRPRVRSAFPGRRSGLAGERGEPSAIDRRSGSDDQDAAGEQSGWGLEAAGDRANRRPDGAAASVVEFGDGGETLHFPGFSAYGSTARLPAAGLQRGESLP